MTLVMKIICVRTDSNLKIITLSNETLSYITDYLLESR